MQVDTAGRAITPARLHRAMNVNIAAGIMGAAWFTVCAPQQILNVFYKNDLGATPGELGNMVSLVQLAALFHLAAIFVYRRCTTRKKVWMAAHILHRLLGFVLAGVSVYAAQGGDKPLGAKIVAGAIVVSWALMTGTASGWWSWMADLVPENIRATFFGRRATVIRAVNLVWFFGITFALDHIKVVSVFYVYAAVFAVGGLVGIVDIAIHGMIPEPKRQADSPHIGWREFTEPLRNRNFLSFSLAIGAWSFSTSVLGPFVAPYITADKASGGIGAPMTWLGINAAIIQVTMVATGTAWGIVMDRFGRKPAVLLGALHPLPIWIGCFFMTQNNYPFILVSTAVVAGLLGPAFWDGSGQLMLTLTPQRNRNAYLSWHMATVGIIAAGGSFLGGKLGDLLGGFRYELWQGFFIGGFHVVALVSFVLSAASVLVLLRIREGSEKPVGFVVTRLLTPGVFRTVLNLRVISGASTSDDTVRALRSMDGASSHLAIADIVARLSDPDPEVREEAARALGRIGESDAEAVDALMKRLRDPQSTIRPDAAAALGQIGDPRAIPALLEGLACPLPEVQDACARALAAFEKPPRATKTVRRLRSVEDASDGLTVGDLIVRLDDPVAMVREEAARALGRIGSHEAVDALVHRLRDPDSTIRPEAALALGDIGNPRAVPALAECLNDGSLEVQDACARALGDIGGRQSIRHLLRLLDEKRPERVVAAGAEAVSRLGILEAAWEIMPRMHETANPVLRRQLAIAMGNILGNLGQFYACLTSETAQPGARIGGLFRGARRAIQSFARPLPKGSRPRLRADGLRDELPRIRRLMESHAYPEALEGLYILLRQLVEITIDRGCPDDVALEYALARDAKLGVGFWFMQEARRYIEKARDAELVHIDALLALYFLSAYRLPPEPRAARRR
ncbi:MAG: MFS transporter [Planctomycetes bacterium]|nr:MFS transporter [Planctomycetota bacterium]